MIEKLRAYGADVDSGLHRCMDNEDMYLRLVRMSIEDGNFDRLFAAMEAGDLSSMDRFMANVLEESAASPEIEALRETIAAQGAEAALMTGSGSVVFGLFSDEEKARAAAEKVSGLGKVFLARPVPAGTEILSVS